MVSHDRNNGIWELDGRQNVRSHAGVQLHLLKFCGGKRARLVQDVLRNCQLTHIVEERCCLDGAYLRNVMNSQAPGQSDSEALNTPNVTVRDLIFCVDRHCE